MRKQIDDEMLMTMIIMIIPITETIMVKHFRHLQAVFSSVARLLKGEKTMKPHIIEAPPNSAVTWRIELI